jgi:hypothetical protein
MNLTKSFNFDNVDNYSYNSDLIEVLNSTSKLKAIVAGSQAYAYWKMDDNIQDEVFRDSSGNSRDLRFAGYTSLNKVPAKINRGLQGINTTTGFCRYGVGSSDFAFERTNTFSLECWVQFTGTATRLFVSKQSNAGNFEGYAINTISSGLLRFVIRDNLTNILAVETVGTYNDGAFHHFVCTYDGTSTEAGMKIYVDNVLDTTVSTSGTLTGTIINNNVSFQISGRDGANNCIDSNTILDEVVVYDRELTAAEVSFRYNNGNGTQTIPGSTTSFSTANPSLLPFGPTGVTEFLSINTTSVENGNDNIQIINILDDVKYYFNGVSWAASNGSYAQSNTFADMLSNITGLNALFEERTQWNMQLFYHSDDGSTTPELSLFEITFNNEEVIEVPTGLITVAQIRALLEGYCINESIVSNQFIMDRRDNYVIPTIINKRLGLSVEAQETRTVYLNGTGEDVLMLPDKNILELVDVTYVNTQTVYAPSLSNFILIGEEGILKAKYNFNESFVRPIFPKGTRNIKIMYKVGYNDQDIPKDLNELIGYLTVIEILTWIEGRSGGGNVQSEGFNRQYGDIGKYTHIRRQLAQRCNPMIRNYRSYTV